MQRILITILMSFIVCSAHAGTLDDFEGGVDWSKPPWNAYQPMWNRNLDQSRVTQTMNPEWLQYRGDFNGGPDYGYIEMDTTQGAKGTSHSLKYTVTGGDIDGVPGGDDLSDGDTSIGCLYFQDLPDPGETITVDGTVFTFQVGPRAGSGQIQIGSTLGECASNIQKAIEADTPAYAAGAQYNHMGVVEIANATTVTPTASNMSWSSALKAAALSKQLYTDHPSMVSSKPAGNFYLYFGGFGGSFTTGIPQPLCCPGFYPTSRKQ